MADDLPSSIVLRSERGLTLTLWGAVRAADENYPATKVPPGCGGWERVPDDLTLAWARSLAV